MGAGGQSGSVELQGSRLGRRGGDEPQGVDRELSIGREMKTGGHDRPIQVSRGRRVEQEQPGRGLAAGIQTGMR